MVENSMMVISELFGGMARLREITVYVVGEVHRWKVQVEMWGDKCGQYVPTYFLHNQHNIYPTILSDTSFLFQSSSFPHCIHTPFPTDPFIIRNVLAVSQL